MTAAAIRAAVRKSGIPQALLASDAGLSYAGIRSWLKGEREPRQQSMRALARGLRKRAAILHQLADVLDEAADNAER